MVVVVVVLACANGGGGGGGGAGVQWALVVVVGCGLSLDQNGTQMRGATAPSFDTAPAEGRGEGPEQVSDSTAASRTETRDVRKRRDLGPLGRVRLDRYQNSAVA